jgi:hypothetical protein
MSAKIRNRLDWKEQSAFESKGTKKRKILLEKEWVFFPPHI